VTGRDATARDETRQDVERGKAQHETHKNNGLCATRKVLNINGYGSDAAGDAG
jgi:hypothetical protein